MPNRWFKILKRRSKAARERQARKTEEEFLRAAADGDLRKVRQLVRDGVDVACIDVDDNTALLLASQFHRNEVLRFLLEEHADKFDINAKDKAGNTPLIWTSEHGPAKMLDLLIEKGANVNDTDNNGQTALIRAASQEHVYFDSKVAKDGDRSLHTDGPASPGSVVNFLLHAKADVNACNHDGYTALHVASFRGHPYVVKRLIQARANIDAKADKQQTPLLLASQRGQSSICDTLIKENCDVNAADERGQTPLMSSCCAAYTYIAERLLRSGADYKLRDNMHGYDAVFWAVEHRRKSIAQVLIKHGCDVNGRDFQGEPLLLKAAQKRSLEIVRLLIRHGADRNASVHGKTVDDLIEHPEIREAMDRGDADKRSMMAGGTGSFHARNGSKTLSTGGAHLSALSLSTSTYNNQNNGHHSHASRRMSSSHSSRSSHQRFPLHRRPKLADIVTGGSTAQTGPSTAPPPGGGISTPATSNDISSPNGVDDTESSVGDMNPYGDTGEVLSAALELHNPLSTPMREPQPLQTVGGLVSHREVTRDLGDVTEMKEDANGRQYPSPLAFPSDYSRSEPTPLRHIVKRMPPNARVQTDPAKHGRSSTPSSIPAPSSMSSHTHHTPQTFSTHRPESAPSMSSLKHVSSSTKSHVANGTGTAWSTAPVNPPPLTPQDSADSADSIIGGPRNSVVGGSGQYKASRLPRDVRHWKKRHVNMWLTHIELQEYSGNFADASVDGELLLMLLGDNGKELLEQELGVTPAFHKIKILKEVRKLANATQEPINSSVLSAAMQLNPSTSSVPAALTSPPIADSTAYGDIPPPSSTYERDTHPYHARVTGEESDLPPFRHIPFSDLTLEEEIGEGTFGTVHKAKWRHSTVAVKMLHEQDIYQDQDLYQDFVREASLMEIVGHHSFIVRFSGACLVPPNLCLVFEYLPYGSVQDLITTCRVHGRPVDLYTKVRLLCNAACGVIHLHAEGVIHRDLAARNLLVDSQLCGRVSDLGMSRLKLRAQRTGHTESRMGPVKWMSPESIQHQQYSEASDAFSFGILIWELLYEQEPYADRDNLQVAFKVTQEALTLHIASDCPPRLAELMRRCWHHSPAKRPHFEYIHSQLEAVLAALDATSAINADEVSRLIQKAKAGGEQKSPLAATHSPATPTPERLHTHAPRSHPSPVITARAQINIGSAQTPSSSSHDKLKHSSLHHSRGNSHRHHPHAAAAAGNQTVPRPSSAHVPSHAAAAGNQTVPRPSSAHVPSHASSVSARTGSLRQPLNGHVARQEVPLNGHVARQEVPLNGHVARQEVPPELLSILKAHSAAAAKLVDIEDIKRSVNVGKQPSGDSVASPNEARPLNVITQTSPPNIAAVG